MRDAEFRGERLGNLLDLFIVAIAIRYHQVSRQRWFGRAQRPDMQVMYFYDTGARLQEQFDFLRVDRGRHGIQREVD